MTQWFIERSWQVFIANLLGRCGTNPRRSPPLPRTRPVTKLAIVVAIGFPWRPTWLHHRLPLVLPILLSVALLLALPFHPTLVRTARLGLMVRQARFPSVRLPAPILAHIRFLIRMHTAMNQQIGLFRKRLIAMFANMQLLPPHPRNRRLRRPRRHQIPQRPQPRRRLRLRRHRRRVHMILQRTLHAIQPRPRAGRRHPGRRRSSSSRRRRHRRRRCTAACRNRRHARRIGVLLWTQTALHFQLFRQVAVLRQAGGAGHAGKAQVVGPVGRCVGAGAGGPAAGWRYHGGGGAAAGAVAEWW
mmetsp:Transcript_45270/g.111050  ORF Transcript_45270/g.111050 Transcript_45270/m.111050 type:complete len:301 (-) Transcript_45270:679-1581(-)